MQRIPANLIMDSHTGSSIRSPYMCKQPIRVRLAPHTGEPDPLRRAIHATVPGSGNAPWRDNAFVSFWDPAQELYGTLHVSTSPNAEGRRARLSLSAGGVTTELVEPLDAGTFVSESIAFDLDSGTITARTPELAVHLTARPRLAIADYAAGAVIPPMGGEPLQHFQTAVDVTGHCRIGSSEVQVDGTGVRDRTWGHRDESVGIAEYAWFFLTFGDWALTAMRFIGDAGFDRTDGFLLTADAAVPIDGIAITRDPAGLCAAVAFDVRGRAPVEATSLGRRGGFWIPMGPVRRGPSMSAYDEFAPFKTSDGTTGFGLAEHGTVRHLS